MKIKRVVLTSLLITSTLAACTSQSNNVEDQAKDTGNALNSSAQNAGNAMKDTAQNAGNAMKDTAQSTGNAMKDTAQNAGNAMKDTAQSTGNAMKDTAQKAGSAVTSTAQKAGDALKDTAQKAGNAVNSTLKIASGFAASQSQIMGMQEGVTKAITEVKAGHTPEAKTAFSKAQQDWNQFGGSIKEKSASDFQAIDTKVKSVNTLLSSASPDATKLVADMQEILTALSTAVSH